MRLSKKVIQNHLFVYEVFSIFITISILLMLSYFTILYRYKSGLKDYNQITALIKFEIKINKTLYSDISILLKDLEIVSSNKTLPKITEPNRAYIVLNRKLVEPDINTEHDILDMLNKENLEKCFFFLNSRAIRSAKGLLSKKKVVTSDYWNCSIFLLTIIFIIFIKFIMSKMNFNTIKNPDKIKYFSVFNKRFLFSFIVLNLTINPIIPFLYQQFNDIDINYCLEFNDNFFNSFFFDRTFIYSGQENNLNIFSNVYNRRSNDTDSKLEYKNTFFALYSPYILQSRSIGYSYLNNILFCCLFVWISGLLVKNYLDDEDSQLHIQVKLQKKLLRVIAGWIWQSIVYFTWLLFFAYSFLNFFDIFHLYHRLIFYNFWKFFDSTIFVFLIMSYMYLYFVFFIIFISIYNLIKLKRKLRILKESNLNIDDFSIRSSFILDTNKTLEVRND